MTKTRGGDMLIFLEVARMFSRVVPPHHIGRSLVIVAIPVETVLTLSDC